jgi:hypothetical protein
LTGSPSPGSTGVGERLDVDAVALDELELRLRHDVWATAVPDAVVEQRIEARSYGPMSALLVAGIPTEPRCNLLLGAGDRRAVGDGHLADASGAIKALGIHHDVPVTAGREGSKAAEAWLSENDYLPRGRRARFVRGTELGDLPEPPLEVDELTDHEAEGECFSNTIVAAFGLNPTLGTLFFELPGKAGWRCYAAIDGQEAAVGCAAMRIEDGVATLALDATVENARRSGAQLSLLSRRIADAADAGCRLVAAETEEPLNGGGPSAAARNLRRAGFVQVSLSTVWSWRPG